MPPGSPYSRSLPRFLAALAATVVLTGIAHANVLFDWTPDSDHITGRELKAVTGPAGTLAESSVFDAEGLLTLGAKQHVEFPQDAAEKIPTTAFSVEATVRIDQPQRWGSVIAHSQDNGSYERGWLLGHNNSRFCFKVSTGGPLIQAASSQDFQPGEWAHLVGVFDGKSARLYIDGKPAANIPLDGQLVPPDIPTPFVLGAYKDKNEFYPLLGRIRNVRIHDTALTPAEITKLGPAGFPFTVHPALRFLAPDSAELSWDSSAPGHSLVRFGRTHELVREVVSKTDGCHHNVVLDQLLPGTTYQYQVTTRTRSGPSSSKLHSFDTSLNEIPPDLAGTITPAPDQRVRDHAAKAVAEAGFERGFCLVLGLTDGALMQEIARVSGLTVVGVESDPARVATLRNALHASKLYGRRISITAVDDLAALPFTSCLANLIVSERTLAGEPLATPADELKRLLRPGGLARIATDRGTPGLATTRSPLDGADDWTHQYADPANTANTDDPLGGANLTEDFSVQWIGRPGGDFGIDRQPRMPAPLAVNGRLFHQGMNRMVALDAYNGQSLWAMEVPDLRRVNMPHDCSNWCADTDTLYVAIRDRAWALDAATGKRNATFELTSAQRGSHDWGFIACTDNMLFGSAVPAGAQFTNFWGGTAWFDKAGQPNAMTVVCSDRIFTYDKHSKKGLWAYGRGLIVNSTITIAGDRMWFVESLPSEQDRPAEGRFFRNPLWLDARVVCLDTTNGEILWDRPIPNPDIELPVPQPPPPPEPEADPEMTAPDSVAASDAPAEPEPAPPEPKPAPPEPKTEFIPMLAADRGYVQVAYGVHTSRGFLLLRSIGGNRIGGFYSYLLFDDKTGELQWHQTTKWRTNNHGSHISHPVVMADRVYVEPTGVSLADGAVLDHQFGPRSGCSTVVGAGNNLFFRGINRCLTQWSLESRTASSWSRLRPSCWLNMLPAQGMMLVPEGGAGCSCGGWLETSLGLLPNSLLRQP